jgi:ferrochelatase
MSQKILLLINTGTPDSPDKASVKRYLSEFLNDPHVIDMPWLFRKILVNLIIIPLRVSRSTALYSRLWTVEGSPLKINLEKLTARLNTKINKKYNVFGVMRYGNPSISSVIRKIPEGSELIIFPLFPQYATATTGSVKDAVMKSIQPEHFSKIKFIEQFCSHPSFIEVFSERIKSYNPDSYDHVIFSYHSLPENHVEKMHPEIKISECSCDKNLPVHGKLCYRAQSYNTTRLIASKLKLSPGSYTTTFQSRLSNKWLHPFTDDIIREVAKNGKKRVLVTSPSFVSDCLETTIEIGEDYKDEFVKAGGKELVLVESLNHGDDWCSAIVQITEDQG